MEMSFAPRHWLTLRRWQMAGGIGNCTWITLLTIHLTDPPYKAEEDAADIANTKVADHMAEETTPTPVVTRAGATVAETEAETEVPVAEVEAIESLPR